MTINLQKGQKIDLTKGTKIKKIKVCLGWETKKYDGGFDFDLDASAFLLNKDGKVDTEDDVVFYNHLKHGSEAVAHSGDDRTGAGDITHSNDKEIISVDLSKVPPNKDKISFTITIYEAQQRRQNFGMVSGAFVRVLDVDTNQEVLRYNLGEDFSVETAVVVGEVYRHQGEWKFNAVGAGYAGGLAALVKNYGIS